MAPIAPVAPASAGMEEVDNLDRTPRATPSAGGRPADAAEKGGEAPACET